MAKKALLDILDKVIGKYVNNFDAEKLNLAVWSGMVELHSLDLDADAVNQELESSDFNNNGGGIPFRVVCGSFDSLHLQIPWKRITSQPIVMKAKGLSITIEPYNNKSSSSSSNNDDDDTTRTTISNDVEKIRKELIKTMNESRLRNNAVFNLARQQGEEGGDQSQHQQKSYVQRLSLRIMENLQIEIEDIHLSIKNDDYSAGIDLKALYFVTTDKDGHNAYIDRKSDNNTVANSFLYKAIKIDSLGIYLDDNNNKNDEDQQQQHSYILSPLSFEAKLRLADDNLVSTTPKYQIRSELSSLSIGLSRLQLELGSKIAKEFATTAPAGGDAIIKSPLFPQYRPVCTVNKENAKEWWKYARRCIGRLTGRTSWTEFYILLRKRSRYTILYKRSTHHESCLGWLDPLSKIEQQELEEIEQDRTVSLNGLMLWRSTVDAEIDIERKKYEKINCKKSSSTTATPNKKSSLFNSLFGSVESDDNKYSKDTATSALETVSVIKLTSEERKELEEISFGQASFATSSSGLPQNGKLLEAQFVLAAFDVRLMNSSTATYHSNNTMDQRNNNPLLTFHMGRVSSTFQSNVNGSFEFHYNVLNVEAKDTMTTKTLFPIVFRTIREQQQSAVEEEVEIFNFDFSESHEGDKKLAIKLKQFEAIASPALVSEVAKFFTIPKDSGKLVLLKNDDDGQEEEKEEAKDNEINDDDSVFDTGRKNTKKRKKTDVAIDVAKSTAAELSNKLFDAWNSKTQKRSSWVVDLDLRAPILVVPEDSFDPCANVLILNFGGLRFQGGHLSSSSDNCLRIEDWFRENKVLQNSTEDETLQQQTVIDIGKLDFEGFTFYIKKNEELGVGGTGDAIIEPFAISLLFGIESPPSTMTTGASSSPPPPRVCTFIEIPYTFLKLSPYHVSRILSIKDSWTELLEEIRPSTNTKSDGSSLVYYQPNLNSNSASSKPMATNTKMTKEEDTVTLLPSLVDTTGVKDTTPVLNTPPITVVHVDINIRRYRLALVDMCNAEGSGSIDYSPDGAEMLVLEGAHIIKSNISIGMDNDRRSTATGGVGTTTKIVALVIKSKEMQAYTAFGHDLKNPVQILEPSEFSIIFKLENINGRVNLGATAPVHRNNIAVKVDALSPFDVCFSIRNAYLIKTILVGFSNCFAAPTAVKKINIEHGMPVTTMAIVPQQIDKEEDDRQTSTLRQGVSEFQFISPEKNADNNSSGAKDDYHNTNSQNILISRIPEEVTEQEDSKNVISEGIERSILIIAFEFKMVETTFTIINDLQGADEALFQISVHDFDAGGKIEKDNSNSIVTQTVEPILVFDIYQHTSLSVKYFDASVHLWQNLLTMPWYLSCKANRKQLQRRKDSNDSSSLSSIIKYGTAIDIVSLPCYVSFTSQLLIGINSALEMMPSASKVKQNDDDGKTVATRNLITMLPYAIKNNIGIDIKFVLHGGNSESAGEEPCSLCPDGEIRYFTWESPKGDGFGGKRLYGQDITLERSVRIIIGNDDNDGEEKIIEFGHLDNDIGQPHRVHRLKNGGIIRTCVKKENQSIVLLFESLVMIQNQTFIPFAVAILKGSSTETQNTIGICESKRRNVKEKESNHLQQKRNDGDNGLLSHQASGSFGIPVNELLNNYGSWTTEGRAAISLRVSPQVATVDTTSEPVSLSNKEELYGTIDIIASKDVLTKANIAGKNGVLVTQFDITCKPTTTARNGEGEEQITTNLTEESQRNCHFLGLRVTVQMQFVEEETQPFISVILEPRVKLVNIMPVAISILTRMPYTYSTASSSKGDNSDNENAMTYHEIRPGCAIDVNCSGPSISVMVNCSETKVGGKSIEATENWIDLPLSSASAELLTEPIRCNFSFGTGNDDTSSQAQGNQFIITEATQHILKQNRSMKMPIDSKKLLETLAGPEKRQTRFFIGAINVGVDHTGQILFGQHVGNRENSTYLPFSPFVSPLYRRRISLLPASETELILLLQSTNDDDDSIVSKKSLPFRIEDIAIGEGGNDSTPIPWKNRVPATHFAYRKLSNNNYSEIHIIPEYVIFNGSMQEQMIINQAGSEVIIKINPGEIKPVWMIDRKKGLILSMEYAGIGATAPIRVDALGFHVQKLTTVTGNPIDNVVVLVETIVGNNDSRLVVKVSGAIEQRTAMAPSTGDTNMFHDDVLDFKIQLLEFKLTINESDLINNEEHDKKPLFIKENKRALDTLPRTISQNPVCSISVRDITMEFHRFFDEENDDASHQDNKPLIRNSSEFINERSQLSVVVHTIKIRDETPGSLQPIVLESSSHNPFFDFCINIQGRMSANLVNIKKVSLNLASANGKSESIVLGTTEDFLWKILDVADKCRPPLSEGGNIYHTRAFSGLYSDYDREVAFSDSLMVCDEDTNDNVGFCTSNYTAPVLNQIYDIDSIDISPINLVVTFKRAPQASNYAEIQSAVPGAGLVDYFTRRLKFTIEKAKLNFSLYQRNNFNGTLTLLVNLLTTIYISRAKRKVVAILSASSLNDWKNLASRDDGDDDFVAGDEFRAVGNLAGQTVGSVFENVGTGLGKGVSSGTKAIGTGIENVTGLVGAKAVGRGINDVVSGFGQGVGNILTGAGTGSGAIVKGVGKGAGQIAGGVTGGIMSIGGGIIKGVSTGDGSAIISGVTGGVTSVGSGVGKGLKTAVVGATDGVTSAGTGVGMGLKSVAVGTKDGVISAGTGVHMGLKSVAAGVIFARTGVGTGVGKGAAAIKSGANFFNPFKSKKKAPPNP